MNLLPRLRFNLRSFSTSRLLWNDKRFEELHIGKTLQSYKPTENEYVRCTIFNETGEMIHHDKDFKRLEFMKMHNLVPRDFRKISRHRHNSQLGGAASTNTQSNSSINVDIVPLIITRSNFVLLSLLNIRALIKHDSVVIFDNSFNSTHGSRLNESHTHSLFLKDMTERLLLKDKDLPYEFRAMESILIHVISNLTTEMKVHITVLQNILNGLENSIDRDKLRYLLIQLKKIAQFHQKTVLIRDLLNDILENDDELNEFYLSDSFRGVPRVGTNHAEIEVLFESYYMTCDEIVQTIHNLKSQIKTTEEIINMILDSNRNELMLLGLKYSTGLLSMGIALYCAALYGMNLENFIEETDGGFGFTVSLSCMLLFALLAISMRQLKRLHKVKMYGVKPR